MTDTTQRVGVLARQIARGGSNVFFTGAGISTESGIPDFRSAGGIWSRYRPVSFDEFMNSRQARVEYWKQKVAFAELMAGVRPNPAHLAIVRLFRMGLVEAVITQNVDGMHQAAGMPEDRVIELHGNGLRVRCMSCREVSPLKEALDRIRAGDDAPQCRCGGFLKPDTISFGQTMPEPEVRKAFGLAQACDCLVVVGSTLVVQPAASIPASAVDAGAFLAVINLSETPLDKKADVLIAERAGTVMEGLVDEVERVLGKGEKDV
ncbi:MAG TPA: Sir2 family NAD-dependent protein deacetylase [Deltaproteobacteria bacterium]|nr:Sir2 family NAD-dependent protein deacetylase [Deltaproteobacteria bacterium]